MASTRLQEWVKRESEKVDRQIEIAIEELPQPVRPVAAHILKAGGKRLRPLLTILFARLNGYTANDIYRLAASMELLHAATLLHDDILDNAATRRGQPAAHTIFGLAKTILAGDALLAHGNLIVASFERADLVDCYARATMETASGEILEMDMLGMGDLPASSYRTMAAAKTAALIGHACSLGARMGNASKSSEKSAQAYGNQLGLAFQFVDDMLDFAPENQTGKPAGGDLREGKMTPPLRLYRQSLSEEERTNFDKAFAAHDFNEEQISQICECVTPFIPEAFKEADACLEKARLALTLVPGGEEKGLLNDLTEYVRNRKK